MKPHSGFHMIGTPCYLLRVMKRYPIKSLAWLATYVNHSALLGFSNVKVCVFSLKFIGELWHIL